MRGLFWKCIIKWYNFNISSQLSRETFKMRWYTEITSRWIPATSGNSWQFYGEKLNWHQFVAVMVELFAVWNRKCCWLFDWNFAIYSVLSLLSFLESLNQYFFKALLPSDWQKQLYCFYFYEGKVSAILVFQARNNENYEPLICLYSVNNP